MRTRIAASAAVVMLLVAGCGGGGETAAMQRVWDSWDDLTRKSMCEAAIQNGTNFYGPARGLAAKAGGGVTEYDAQGFLLEVCPDAWLMGGA